MSPHVIDLGQPAHIGHIVLDLDEAMQRYSDEFGVAWASVVTYGRSRFSCTVGGGVQIEVIEQLPGTVWTREHGAPFHHLAYWTDHLSASTSVLVERGLRVEASGPTFAYLRNDGGMRLELMDTAMRPAWDGWLAGGQLFGPTG